MFSNAKSVEINGKEVQSIVLKNGGVLYEKLGNTNLELTYSPSTVYNGDTVTLTATLIDGNISNKEISLLASEPCFDKYFPPQGLSVSEEFCIKQYQSDIVWAESKRAIFEDRLMVRNTGSVQYTPITYPVYIKKIDSNPTYEFYHSPNGQKTLLLTETLDNEEFSLNESILGQSNYTTISTNNNGIASTNIICDNFSSVNITASYNNLSDNVNIIVNDKYDLDLVSDKNILSSYDNDVATLTATLTKNNSPVSNEQVLFYDSDKVNLATYYDWLDVFLFTVTSENQGEIIFDTTNAEHNNFYTEDATSGGGYSNGGRVKFVITDTQVETWRYNSSTDTWTKSFMLYNLPVKIGFAYGTEIISDTAKIPFFASATTNNNGEATATYNSIGIGDVSITAECMNLQETYDIQDTFKYYPNEISKTSTTSTGSYIFTLLFNRFSFVSDSFVAEFDIKVNGDGVGVCISSTSDKNKFLWLANQIQSGISKKAFYYRDSANAEKETYYNTMNTDTYYHIKMEYSDSTLKLYDETGLLNTITGLSHYNGDTRSIYFGEWMKNRTVTVKNVLIKPL